LLTQFNHLGSRVEITDEDAAELGEDAYPSLSDPPIERTERLTGTS